MPERKLRRVSLASITTSCTLPLSSPRAAATARVSTRRRRRIDPQVGRALLTLAHAIEYLTDEFVREGNSKSASNQQLEAVLLLMALNHQVYSECPELPTLGERFRALLGFRATA